MKARFAILLIMMAALASQIATAGEQNIPPLSGRYSSVAVNASVVQCLNPTNHTPETCSTSGVLVVPFSVIEVGHITYSSGIGCEIVFQVVNSLPPNAAPPIVNTSVTRVNKVIDYDPATGIGTISFTAYSGGSCSGANFDSSGATEISFGTLQFVVTDGGKRAELIVTQLEGYPTNNVGGVSFFITDLKQTP